MQVTSITSFLVFVLLEVGLTNTCVDAHRLLHLPQSLSVQELSCSVLDHGAVGDNVTSDSDAIDRTITACMQAYQSTQLQGPLFSASGHMQMTIEFPTPKKAYRITRPITLPSNTTLYLHENTMLFSAMSSPNNTTPAPTCSRSYWSKQDTTGIICSINATNVAIIGASATTSVVDGGGWPWYTSALFGQGPRLFEPVWTNGITMTNITFTHSPSWTLHMQFSRDIHAEDIRIINPRFSANTDGFDPDACTNVVLKNAFIDTGDDGISIKSANWTAANGSSIMVPARNIYMTNVTVLSRNVCVGSATFGGVYDVLMEDSTIGDDNGSSPWAIKYKSHQFFPGPMVNHTYRRIKIGKIAPNNWQQPHGGTAFIIGLTYGDKPPKNPPPCPPMCPLMKDITFEDIIVDGAVTAGSIDGLERDPIESLTFSNVTFRNQPSHSWSCQHVKTLNQDKVSPPIKC